MSKFDEKMEAYRKALSSVKKGAADDALLTKVAKGLGPSIYLKDASLVSCSDDKELDRVKTNFLKKKLGMKDEGKMDAAIKAVCGTYTDNHKYRAVFYYLLVKNLGKESVYN